MGNCNMVCFYQNKVDIQINNNQILKENTFKLDNEDNEVDIVTSKREKLKREIIKKAKTLKSREILFSKEQIESKDKKNLFRTKRITSNDLMFNNSFSRNSESLSLEESHRISYNSTYFLEKMNQKFLSEKESYIIFNNFILINQIKKIQKNFKIFLDRKFNTINLFPVEDNINIEFAFERLKTIKYDDGSIYRGQIISEKRKGLGIILNENYKFIGNFNNDTSEGFGEMCNNTGYVFLGFWQSFKLNGFARFTNKINGTIFEGEFKDNIQNGFGIEKWVSESSYTGEYFSDKKNGIGILRFSDNSLYEGEFKNEDMNGLGKYTYKDGSCYYGEWKDNKMHGFGIFSWSDGRIFEGEFYEDRKEGFGIMRNKQNSIYLGYWRNNFLEGEGCKITEKKVEKFIFVRSKKIKVLPEDYYFEYEDLILQYKNQEA